jgi:hypothetical protein
VVGRQSPGVPRQQPQRAAHHGHFDRFVHGGHLGAQNPGAAARV